jgi:hypothetical protein
MSLKLNSSGGGSVTLQEPVTASARTLNLPNVDGTVVAADGSGNVNVSGNVNATGSVSATGNVNATGELLRNGAVAACLGVGQTWQNVTSSRAAGVTYTNTTGRPIFVSAYFNGAGTGREAILTTEGIGISFSQAASGQDRINVSGIIRAGADYIVTFRFGSGGTLEVWSELR